MRYLSALQYDPFGFRLFLFGHDRQHHIFGQFAVLRKAFQTLRLRKRRRGLFAVDGFRQPALFFRVQIGNLDGGVERKFSLVHQIEQFGKKLGQANITLNLDAAHTKLFSQCIASMELLTNLVKS